MDGNDLIPDRLRDHLGWALGLLAGSEVSASEVPAHVDEAVVAEYPIDLIVGAILGGAEGCRPARVLSCTELPDGTVLVRAAADDGRHLAMMSTLGPTGRLLQVQARPYAPESAGEWSQLPPTREAEGDVLLACAERWRARLRLPGLLAAVVKDGQVVWQAGLGTADLTEGRVPDERTVLRIGSITKTLTGVAVMTLVQDGVLDLDEPVAGRVHSTYLHDAEAARTLTARHLLSHTGGLAESDEIGLPAGEPVPTLAQFLSSGIASVTPPGAAVAYSNMGFSLLGQLVEDVTGTPFVEYVRTRVLDVWGMSRSDLLRTERTAGPLFTGYDVWDELVLPAPYREIIVLPAGSLFSVLPDMAAYVAAICGRGTNAHGTVLRPEVFDLMVTAQPQPESVFSEQGMQLGLSFILGNVADHPVVWHNGGWPGAHSQMWVAPSANTGVLLFTNCLDHLTEHTEPLAAELLALALEG